MSLFRMAWRNLMRRKTRTLLTTLSIVIGVASTFGVIASVDTAKRTFPLYLKAAFGKADFNLYGTQAYFPEEVLHDAEKLNGVTAVGVLKENTTLHLEKAGISAIQKRVELSGYSNLDTPVTDFKVEKGSLTSGGAVITDRTARAWNVNVGDTLSFDTKKGTKRIQIAAIVRYTVELMGPSSWMMANYHPWSVAVPLSIVQDWFGLQGKVENVQIKSAHSADMATLQSQIDQLVRHHKDIYMQPVVIDFKTQFKELDSFYFALYLAGFLGIALSALIIFNSMYVSMNERRKEFAALKTIGYTSRQLQAAVLQEVLLQAAVGTALGLVIGLGLATALKSLIFLVFSVYDEGSMVLGKGIVISVLAGILVPLAASMYPLRQVSKVTVAGVLKGDQIQTNRRKKWPVIVGSLLILSAFFIKHFLLVVPLMVGVAMVFPALLNLFTYLCKPVFRLVFGFSGEMALLNLKRNLSRASMTSVVLCQGIALIVLMSSLNSALLQTYERTIQATYGGNLDVQFHHMDASDLARLRATDGVADAQTYPEIDAVWNLKSEKRKLPVYGVGADWINRFPLFTTSGQPSDLIKSLQDNEIVLDKISYQVWGGQVGQNIQLQTLDGPKDFKVVAVVDTMKNSGYGAFVSEASFRENFGITYEKHALVIKDKDTTPLQLRDHIFQQFGDRIEQMFGPEDWVTVVKATLTGSFSVINGLVVLSIIISGIGITNTLLINIMERIRELGMMRAVGLTRRQVTRMVLVEGLGIGVAATLIGAALGVLLVYLTSTFLEVHSLTYHFEVAWTSLLCTGLFGLLVSIFASLAPASRAAKTRLTEALRYE